MAEIQEFDSIEEILEKLPKNECDTVKRVLYGKGTDDLNLPQKPNALSEKYNIQLLGCRFSCNKEELRPPRIVRVGLFQHKTPLPTWSAIKEMREAVFKMASEALEVAALSGVNVFCFQEAWSKYNKAFFASEAILMFFKHPAMKLILNFVIVITFCQVSLSSTHDYIHANRSHLQEY
ncbi:unnamed protein product [Acanthoscelides obtectus]|uniref:Uncharacterized protein n=1 Tax=Acanthoscelides obtectus TaxID=200917 RepID=A0A9P0K059_ACAOB|nr:unnamed protein product [Acanthoscelides obtectus]CAK1646138.1 Beta-ureidopropionase [Acanthoscelides obtectus]